MPHNNLIQSFYQSFSDKNVSGMIQCYHENIFFHDPAFGTLQGEDVKSMWKMLLERGKENLSIEFDNIREDEKGGEATWCARYTYGPKKRNVINKVNASFEFKEGKIIRHTDYFDLWRWSRQALGLSGWLLGWSSFMKMKIQQRTNTLLKQYMLNHSKTSF